MVTAQTLRQAGEEFKRSNESVQHRRAGGVDLKTVVGTSKFVRHATLSVTVGQDGGNRSAANGTHAGVVERVRQISDAERKRPASRASPRPIVPPTCHSIDRAAKRDADILRPQHPRDGRSTAGSPAVRSPKSITAVSRPLFTTRLPGCKSP